MPVCNSKDGKRPGVVENRRSTLKPDMVVAQIFSGFLGIQCKDIPQCATPTSLMCTGNKWKYFAQCMSSGQPHADLGILTSKHNRYTTSILPRCSIEPLQFALRV